MHFMKDKSPRQIDLYSSKKHKIYLKTCNNLFLIVWYLCCRHGFGIYHMKNGDIYCGYFRNNEMEGEGAYFYHHGDVYRG